MVEGSRGTCQWTYMSIDVLCVFNTSFSTLSSVAMDECCTLEREEALRRAEYEIAMQGH